ncbi:GNAT family N-acetyltransferase [Altererythrobacter sp. TH136]|uniref:GNAT family N-acetyltransferase n=1 Tax=Altererythrobacter sp. TH136 TaxID=2067415 RepID=UPI0032C14EBC
MNEDDLDRIMAVMDAAFDPAWAEAWTRRQIADSLAFAHTHCRLIAADGVAPSGSAPAAGFTLVRAAPGEEELLLIGVVPGHRGKGLGRLLLEQVMADARSRGADRVFLEMRFNNPAEQLYRAMGFQPIGRRKDYYRLPDGSKLDAITFGVAI